MQPEAQSAERILTMRLSKYELHAKVLSDKYGEIIQGYEHQHDDRRIAWNCYNQLLAACKDMNDINTENSFICAAVNNAIKEQEAQIDEIIFRFEGLTRKGGRWVNTGSVSYKVYREATEEGDEDVLVKQTNDRRNAFKLACECEECTGIGHYIQVVGPDGATVRINDF